MKRQLKPTLSIQDYEQAADTFIRLLFEFTEQHIMVSAQKKTSKSNITMPTERGLVC